jgi:hypothetical protein
MTRTTSISRTSKPITTGELNRTGVAYGAIGGIGGVLGSVNAGGSGPIGGVEDTKGVGDTDRISP